MGHDRRSAAGRLPAGVCQSLYDRAAGLDLCRRQDRSLAIAVVDGLPDGRPAMTRISGKRQQRIELVGLQGHRPAFSSRH